MKFFKRIRRRFFISLTAVAIFAAISLFLYVQTTSNLKDKTQQTLRNELVRTGEMLVSMFERRVTDAITQIEQSGLEKTDACSPRFYGLARHLVGSLDHVQDIGFISSDGTMRCSALRPNRPVAGFMMPWSLETPALSLAILEDAKLERRPLALIINKGLNQRYVVRFAPTLLPSTIGSTPLRPFLSYDALLTNGDRWIFEQYSNMPKPPVSMITRQAYDLRDLPARFSHSLTSEIFPLIISVSADVEALLFFYSQMGSSAISLGLPAAFIILTLLLIIGWRSGRSDFEQFTAFDEGKFIAHYQPVVDMANGSILGCEVLLRFQTADGRLIQPASFIAYAETTGAIMEVTRNLLARVAAELDDLSKEFGDLKIGINLTGKHFENMSVVDEIQEAFGKSHTSFQQLVFELTERHPVQDFEMARMVIAGIQELGASVALDDAGTGHGGFSYLQKLGLDVIKIDKMFVDSFSEDVTTMTIIDIIVELAKSLDMGIIAEGVENQTQVNALRKLGISAAQGYFFSPALPPEKYIDLVRRSKFAKDKFALFDETRVSQPKIARSAGNADENAAPAQVEFAKAS